MQSSAITHDAPDPPPPIFIFNDTIWLGGCNDQRPVTTFQEYSKSVAVGHAEFAAQLQCLFTFGLLEAVMEIKVPESILLNDDRTMMTSVRLPALLQTWRNRIRALGDTEASHAWAQRTAQTMKEAHKLMERSVLLPEMSRLFLSDEHGRHLVDVLSAIACIADAISSSQSAFPIEHRGENWSFLSDLLGERKRGMVQAGWCPFIVRSLDGASSLQYASAQEVPRGDVHYVHDKCSSTHCVVNTVNTSTYQNRHAPGDSCSGCVYATPPVDEIVKLLEQGQVPVLRVQYDDCNAFRITVVPFSSALYVAISHVWSDGLGSTSEVGLPSCQIHRLAKLVELVSPGSHFWIDSLCVPQRRDMRKRAIGLMGETYRRATMVLVIDSGIRTCSMRAPLEKKLLRIITSGWMQRLWTLQEGLLADRLVFEFLGGAVDIGVLAPFDEGLFNNLHVQLGRELFRLRSYQVARENFGLAQVARALRWRSTSRAEDETLAICGLLGVDAAELVDLSGEERMKLFLIRVGKLPRSIIFTLAPKLRLPNFRWAPSTFMTRSEVAPVQVDSSPATCTPDGLWAEFSVIFFDKITMRRDAPDRWFVQHEGKNLNFEVGPGKEPSLEADDTAQTYDCNGLLFLDFPGMGQMGVCAAVSIAPLAGKGRDNLFECRYRRRQLAVRTGNLEAKRATGLLVKARGAGRMEVLMV